MTYTSLASGWSRAEAEPLNQIICVKWGSKYGPEYVNRLFGMVSRNVSEPFKLVCLTDSTDGIRGEVECAVLPDLGCEHPVRTSGKWRKVVLWQSDLAGLAGPVLFIDLDSVIVDNIDGYFEFGDPDDVVLARNWALPAKRLGQTSVFRFPAGKHSYMLEKFRADPQAIADRFHYEQHFVSGSIAGGIKLWPEGWTRHFRLHCLPRFPMRYFKAAHVPRGAKIITFPGGPDPEYVALGRWSAKAPPHRRPIEHFMATFGPNRIHPSRIEHMKRYVLPCDWIETHWRE